MPGPYRFLALTLSYPTLSHSSLVSDTPTIAIFSGVRKWLKIHYVVRGFMGTLRVREKNDLLVAAVELGYPPRPPRDEA